MATTATLQKERQSGSFAESLQPSQRAGQRTRVFVISDTHFGAAYSDATDAENTLRRGLEYEQELGKVLKQGLENKKSPARICVLLGDIYEYINHPLKKDPEAMEKVIAAHMEHLYELVKGHPECKFVYVVGNHERVPTFDRAIDELALRVEKELGPGRLEITRHFKKIGDGLFMHGDQAMDPKLYHVSLNEPNNYSNVDRRYDESYVEINRPHLIQLGHDGGNVLLPWPVGRMFHRAAQCSRAVFTWCHWYDQQQIPEHGRLSSASRAAGELSIMPKPEPPTRILDGVHHIFIGHTHDPFTGKSFEDPETGKTYRFYNTGASIFRIGFGKQINRHCFNALNVYLDTADPEGPQTHITEVASFKWPQHHWQAQEDSASRSR